jgi:hypothetical protein
MSPELSVRSSKSHAHCGGESPCLRLESQTQPTSALRRFLLDVDPQERRRRPGGACATRWPSGGRALRPPGRPGCELLGSEASILTLVKTAAGRCVGPLSGSFSGEGLALGWRWT